MTGEAQPLVLVLGSVLLRRWRLVFGVPLVVAVVAVAVSFLVPSRFTASTSFAPTGRRSIQLPSILAGVASQLLPDLGGEPVQSPGFYVQVLQSRELMAAVLQARYVRPGTAGDSATLLQILRPGGRTAADSLERGVRILRRLASVSADNQTNIVRVSVETSDPVLSADVANRFEAELNAFNLRSGREQAQQRRIFVEERRNEVAQELRDAEDALQRFLQTNRVYETDPNLRFAYDRLQRQVQLRQEMYLTLSRAYENMRVEEANTVPALTVIDHAIAPRMRSAPRRSVWLLMALFLSATLMAAAAAALHYRDVLRSQHARAYGEVAGLWREMLADVRTPGRRARPA